MICFALSVPGEPLIGMIFVGDLVEIRRPKAGRTTSPIVVGTLTSVMVFGHPL
jgi:hypothetical protein